MSRIAIVVVVAIALGLFFPVAVVTLLMLGVLLPMVGESNPCEDPSVNSVAVLADDGARFRLPLTGRYRVTSSFGPRVHPLTGIRRAHRGVDLALNPHYGPVLAMASGTVIRLGSGGGGGNAVIIDHGGGLVSKYLHLKSFTVKEGQQVAKGQPVGIEGATGGVTGPHLHWEVWVNGEAIDPRAWATKQGLQIRDEGVAPPLSVVAVSSATTSAEALPVATASENTSGQNGATPSPTGDLPKQVAGFGREQLTNAAHIIVAGRKLGLNDRTVTLGVTAAIGESSLINIDRGDRVGPDSRGLFQQRDNGAWGSYADRMNPEIAATNFFKALIQVPNYEQLAPTIAIHKTQRNANPYHYAKFWAPAVLIVAALIKFPGLLEKLSAIAMAPECEQAFAAMGPVPDGPQGPCPATKSPGERGLQPHALRGLRCGAKAFPKITTMYGIGDRGGKSDHPSGNAVDFMLDRYRQPAVRAYGWQLAEWTRANASQLNVKYIIFDMKYWRPGQAGWRPYTRFGANPDDNLAHRNHVHVSYH